MKRMKQRGAASLFIVIFTALLVTVVTVGFTQVMIRNQQQSQAADLSQSAYDAALAGVEDAKRILIYYAANCENTATPASDCAQVASAMDDKNCDTTLTSGLVSAPKSGTESEVQVNDPELNQSYTCVKIERFSNSYPGIITTANPSIVLPISPHGANATTLRVSWFTSDDVTPKGSPIDTTNFLGVGVPLPRTTGWSSYRPLIIRSQYIPANAANDSLDTAAQTVFGYPKRAGGIGNTDTPRRSSGFRISSAMCDTNFLNTLGACHIDIALSPAINDGQTGFVQLSAVYLASQLHVNAQLLGPGGSILPLNGIPTVDATGRTAERFRRVVAQVKVGAGISSDCPQPRAALDVTGNICKTMFLTDTLSDYSSGGCDPAN